MDSGANMISIAKLKALNFENVAAFEDRIILTEQIDHLDLFKYPCRVNGIVCLVCLEGEIFCNVNLKEYHLTAGTLLVNFSSSLIQVREETGHFVCQAALVSYDCLDSLQIDFGRRLSFYLGVRNNAVAHLPEMEVQAYRNIFGLLTKYIAAPVRPETGELVDGLIHVLGMMVISSMGAFGNPSEKNEMPDSGRAEVIFERFMSVLAQQHARERNVSFYADALCLTPNYLSLVVRKYSGHSAAHWINEFTVTEAKVLLRFTDLNIQQVSTKLGFPSQSAFGKYFKQYVKVSPAQFRKNVRHEG